MKNGNPLKDRDLQQLSSSRARTFANVKFLERKKMQNYLANGNVQVEKRRALLPELPLVIVTQFLILTGWMCRY